MITIDAKGLSCPEPVVRVQKGIAAHPEGLAVVVDAMVCVENIRRFAASRGYAVSVDEQDGAYTLKLTK